MGKLSGKTVICVFFADYTLFIKREVDFYPLFVLQCYRKSRIK